MSINLTNTIDSYLFSYAFLKVNNDVFNRDYYDNFIPFVKEVLKSYDEEFITATAVKPLLEEHFKLNLPTQVVNTLLKRLKRQNILRVENRAYKLVTKEIDNNGFQEKKESILVQHSLLMNSLIQYAATYNVTIDVKEAEVAILNLIKQNSLTLIKEVRESTKLSVPYSEERRNTLIAANFIINIRNNNPVMFTYLTEIVKGYMLVESVFLSNTNNLDNLKMKFKNTEIYFDTSFLLYALGYSGPELQQPCTELIKLLKESNGILRCFRHNVDEAIAILEYIKRNYKKSDSDRHNTIQNFLEQGYEESDIEEIIFGLEDSIKSDLKIQIIERIPYEEHKNVIGEQELKDFLQLQMNYRNSTSLDTDVSSISAIYRIRKGSRPLILEECKALFVTTNFRLAKNTRDYFIKEYEEKLISPVIHDSVLMNLVWLKNPQSSPNLQEILLVADCYAAIQPSEKLWKQYLSMLDALQETGEIPAEKIFRLKYSQGVKELLSSQTLGDEELLTIGTIRKIQQEIDKKIEEDKKIAVENERKLHLEEKGKLEAKLIQASESINEKDKELDKYKRQMEKIARGKAKRDMVILYLIFIAVFAILYTLSNWYGEAIPYFDKVFILVLAVIGIFGISIRPFFNKIYNFLVNYHLNKL